MAFTMLPLKKKAVPTSASTPDFLELSEAPQSIPPSQAAGSLGAPDDNAPVPPASQGPMHYSAQMNTLHACNRHELLQASFARKSSSSMAFTMLPLKKKAVTRSVSTPDFLELSKAPQSIPPSQAAGSLGAPDDNAPVPPASQGPMHYSAQMNTFQACHRHELLQASFARKSSSSMAFTMLPLKKMTCARSASTPDFLELSKAPQSIPPSQAAGSLGAPDDNTPAPPASQGPMHHSNPPLTPMAPAMLPMHSSAPLPTVSLSSLHPMSCGHLIADYLPPMREGPRAEGSDTLTILASLDSTTYAVREQDLWRSISSDNSGLDDLDYDGIIDFASSLEGLAVGVRATG